MSQVRYEKTDPFFDWFGENVSLLWSFSHFFSRANSEYLDEMLYILNLSRSRISSAMKKGRTKDEAMFEFLRLWFNRLKRPRTHPAVSMGDLNWEEQFLIFALINRKISISQVSSWMRKKEASIKFELLNAVAKFAGVPETEIRSGSRDCVRHDLYFADTLVENFASDPLKIVNPAMIKKHLGTCPRCQDFEKRLETAMLELSSKELYPVPAHFHEQVFHDVGTRWNRLVKREWFGSLPLWIKVPVQVTVALVVLTVVLNSTQVRLFSGKEKPSWVAWSEANLRALKTSLAKRWDNLVFTSKTSIFDLGPEMKSANNDVVSDSSAAAVFNIQNAEALSRFLNKENFSAQMEKSVESKEAAKLPTVAVKPTKADAIKLETKPEAPKVATPLPAPAPAPVVAVSKPVAPKAPEAPGQTIFYRWGAYSDNLAADSTQINELLKSAQAEMAGELPFGAEYKGGRYFHFSIPKAEFDALMKKVKTLGLISFSSNQADSDREIPIDRSRVVFLLLPKSSSSESNGN